jgi:hypothetical protein
MKIIRKKIKLFNKECEADLMTFDKSDRLEWKKFWDAWKQLRDKALEYHFRGPNLLEGISETAFCLYKESSKRVLKVYGKGCNASADTYDIKKFRAEQIKAASVKNDLTSFGPKSKWDDLYFLDFYRNGDLDGSFDVYLIDSKFVYNFIVHKGKNETFIDQQKQKRRPRLSIKEIIKENSINPIDTNVKVWK